MLPLARHVTDTPIFYYFFFFHRGAPGLRLALSWDEYIGSKRWGRGGKGSGPQTLTALPPFAKGEWVSRRRYHKQDLRTQTSCLRWILADGRGAMSRGGDEGRRVGGAFENGGPERRHRNSGHLSHQSPGRDLRVS